MLRRIFSMLLSVLLLLTSALADTRLYYEEDHFSGGTAITGWSGDAPVYLIIPEYVGGSRVTAIEGNAFESCTSLRSVTLPASVEYIAAFAFMNCTNLTELNIPQKSRLQDIDIAAFYECPIAFVRIPDCCGIIAPDSFEADVAVNYLNSRGDRVTQRWGDVTDDIKERLGGA